MQTRRMFIKKTLSGLALAGIAISFPGCADSDNSPVDSDSGVKIICNTDLHPHGFTPFDPDNLVAVNVTLTGGHTHSVILAVSDLEQLAAVGSAITKNSAGGDHIHRVTFTRVSA